ncbi:RNA polymerase sigma-70 factor, ECF subfamily [Cyclobacterium xiamenense]|uniref:RNA polymerase sigma-70 factor, ECF subfamily n=1 Tax=Cyclobacterium xiamenense TaxID=1297121 RepID=A0A1H7C6Q5_9BACT|nr:RNA polymerase sigma factor [Cyclobacterium xiamenense]SEJ82320.1 RNA polymerase sigma-70 factor, ECF subfamily [Cyclobacterium xiamenense]
MVTENKDLKKALEGDIKAFQSLFSEFQPQLKSYLYRLLTDRNDTDDLTHDTFVKAFDKISTFKGNSEFKTWVFQIATNLAYDFLKKKRRWLPNAQDQAKSLAMSTEYIQQLFVMTNKTSNRGRYEVKEHIDFCFTCISKTLSIEEQIAIILKDIYAFSRTEIADILGKTEGVVKHLLFNGRKTMIEIFDNRCALINKNGACHQCTELAGIYNPKQTKQEELMKIKMVKSSEKESKEKLYQLRSDLVAAIDPLNSEGADMQDIIMQCTRLAINEIETIQN